jgi:hypothetical protein
MEIKNIFLIIIAFAEAKIYVIGIWYFCLHKKAKNKKLRLLKSGKLLASQNSVPRHL